MCPDLWSFRVLKRRENRLKREQVGLKSLIAGLVNGPVLLQAWEAKWRETFGGEEKDEIEEDIGSDEDGDGDDDDDEDTNRPKKKARTVKVVKPQSVIPSASRPLPSTPSVLPEKRKRGRPRKIPVPIPASVMVTSSPPPASVDHEFSSPSGQAPNRQYLLAVFAFMSFFNSSLKTPSPYAQPHTHKGMVLDHSVPVDLVARTSWGDILQIFHLFVSALVFFSIIAPWIPNSFKRTNLFSSVSRLLNLPNLTNTLYVKRSPSSSSSDRDTSSLTMVQNTSQPNMGIDRIVLLDALTLVGQNPATEATTIRKALGISFGIVGLCQGVVKAGKRDRGIELNQLEQRAWVRLGELVAFDGKPS
jgi:hypothetical protein